MTFEKTGNREVSTANQTQNGAKRGLLVQIPKADPSKGRTERSHREPGIAKR